MKRSVVIVLFLILALVLFVPLPGITVGFSGESFVAGNHQVIVAYCYSLWTGNLCYAIVQTWPKEATVEEKTHDPRVGKTFLDWPTIRHNDGRMLPAGANGHVYFFAGDRLKTMRVRMNESEDTAGIGDSKTLDEVWACFSLHRTDRGSE
jgi:hypothetical protein